MIIPQLKMEKVDFKMAVLFVKSHTHGYLSVSFHSYNCTLVIREVFWAHLLTLYFHSYQMLDLNINSFTTFILFNVIFRQSFKVFLIWHLLFSLERIHSHGGSVVKKIISKVKRFFCPSFLNLIFSKIWPIVKIMILNYIIIIQLWSMKRKFWK